ncbi:FecR domain-containing protein [Chitinasiproducens palmae]|uniref:FecR family protein n=1 Tax=Chitinasiproducens palmae TaxID=1770053 RepID=A0A1H2PJY0_9BURK|nr:FecR domain-containing protein [Chitinasiproducens palmae]SDV46244.1 FecR family protein [Chitinasiproducens palmae]
MSTRAPQARRGAACASPNDGPLDQALQWLVLLWSGEADASQQAAFARWHGASAANQAAWRHVQQINDRLGSVPPELANTTFRQVARRQPRRGALRAIALLAGTGALAWGGRELLPWPVWAADYRTGVGARRALVLADGSRLTLNTDTAVDVRFDVRTRRIMLWRGEILIVTGHGAAAGGRPLRVETAQGSILALGTRFSVRQEDRRSRVAVFEGAVSVEPRRGGAPLRLSAGEQTTFSAGGAALPSSAEANALGWTRGELIVEQMRLDAFLRELDRYRPGVLRCDPAVAALRVSGVFPIGEPERVLAALERALPVRAHYATRYWVMVRAR